MNRYWRGRAAASPAPNRRRDPRSRIARSRRRASWAPPRERFCASTRPWALVLVLIPIAFETIEQIGKSIRYALVHHVVVHGAKLLPGTARNPAPKLCRLGGVFLIAGSRGFHRFLLSHRFAFIHCHTLNPLARPGAGPPYGVY